MLARGQAESRAVCIGGPLVARPGTAGHPLGWARDSPGGSKDTSAPREVAWRTALRSGRAGGWSGEPLSSVLTAGGQAALS